MGSIARAVEERRTHARFFNSLLGVGDAFQTALESK